MDHEWWCPENADDCFCDPDVMGRSGGDDLAEIRCDKTRHVGCDHDPDRVQALDNGS
jgi:hypothetical protein